VSFDHHPLLQIASMILVSLMTIVLYFAWQTNKSFPGIKDWFLGFLCATSNYVFYIFKPKSIPIIPDLVLQFLLICTGLFAYLGCQKFIGQKGVSVKLIGLVIVGVLCLSAGISIFAEFPAAGFIVSSLVAGLFCLLGATKLIKPSKIYDARNLLAFMLLTHGLFMIIRPLFFQKAIEPFIVSMIGFNGYIPIVFQQIIFTPLMAISALLLINSENIKKLRFQAEYDDLTNARNRNSFFDHLQVAASLCHRLKSPLTVLAVDLDRFKTINDQYGHQAGDEVLKSFSNIVKKCIREEDGFGRIGGEEFAIYLINTPVDTANAVAQRIRSLIESSTVMIDDQIVRYTASIGIARHDENSPIQKSLKNADQALYKAKRNGRNRVETWQNNSEYALN